MRILTISAHPDDEIIGAGGTLAWHVNQGHEVYWCVVTQGHTPHWSEAEIDTARRQVDEVRGFMGFREVFRLGFPTVTLNAVPHIELSSALGRVVEEVRPEVVYTTPSRDINLDHNVVHDATLVATRPLPGSPVRKVLAYEVAPTSRYAVGGFTPNVFVNIEPYLEKKLEAMALYRTELREFPHPRSLDGLRLIARERGLSVGLGAAEGFQLVRERVGP